MAARRIPDPDVHTTVQRLPMVREVFDRLRDEVERLADSLTVIPTLVLTDEMSEDVFTAAVPAAWEHQRGAQRLATLRRVLAQAEVVTPDGTAVVGSRVLVRDDDGSVDTYLLVAPSEADARNGSISSESPLGRALLGCRAGETADVAAPSGTRRVTVEQVD